MSRSKTKPEVWDQIFEDLILDAEPPIRYIKDAVIVTKNGGRFRVSADDFADIVAREKLIDPEQSDIQSCSISIDFSRIKRDVNRWSHRFIANIEAEAAKIIAETSQQKIRRRTPRKPQQ